MIPGDASESLTEDGPVPGYDDDGQEIERLTGLTDDEILDLAEDVNATATVNPEDIFRYHPNLYALSEDDRRRLLANLKVEAAFKAVKAIQSDNDGEANHELDQVNELLEAVTDVLADYANEVGVVPSINRLYNADRAYHGEQA